MDRIKLMLRACLLTPCIMCVALFSKAAYSDLAYTLYGSEYYFSPESLAQNPYVKYSILVPLYLIVFLIFIYVLRHYLFAFSRLFGNQSNLYSEIIVAKWPSVTVVIPAHNEEIVIQETLTAIANVDYPTDLLQVIVINDRSEDKTAEIIDKFVEDFPGLIQAFHRYEGTPGKSASLKDALSLVKNEILIILDADNVAGLYLIKRLVTPFYDPEVGAVMGRVVPLNTGFNLLTRLLDMERSAGYQVDQQARQVIQGIPQYGGTAGGVRMQALQAVGGWKSNALAEDTEITFRLICAGWKVIYQNNCECMEQSPQTWPVRLHQIQRWSKGHNQVLMDYFFKLIVNKKLSFFAKIDGLLLLTIYLLSPLLLIGWILFIIAFYLNILAFSSTILIFLTIISFSCSGNFSLFFEIATAVHLDSLRGVKCNRIRLLPMNYLNFFVSMFAISAALLQQITVGLFKKEVVWIKTQRFKKVDK
jgi:cellulose synthase/poly-beta-1,6-N-acetylglucosamine synthase-like glycosyltransferase